MTEQIKVDLHKAKIFTPSILSTELHNPVFKGVQKNQLLTDVTEIMILGYNSLSKDLPTRKSD